MEIWWNRVYSEDGEMPVLLSISVLISNRLDTVEKCLKSLAALRGRVPSELILVDTGCGEHVRRIIESYGDKVVDFEWCDDFAKARNAGLRLAEGEWFLYLDDDEWFENTDEIEDFFLSGRYRRYGCGSYLVRNYFDLEGQRYRDEYVGRMVRLKPDTKFIYAIHEGFSRAEGPRIRLHSYVHHYGYAFRNVEEAKKHGERNISLLLKQHEKEPGELRHNAHLVQEYNALREWEESIRVSWEGIRNAVPGVSTEQFLGGLYVNIVRNRNNLSQYSEAARMGEEYLLLSHSNELDKAAVCYNLCISYLEMEEYARSLKAVERYLDFHGKWEKNREATAFYEYMAIDFMSGGCRQAALCIAVQDEIRLGNASGAAEYFQELDWAILDSMLETQGVQGMVRELAEVWLREEPESRLCHDMIDELPKEGVLTDIIAAAVADAFRKEPERLLIHAERMGLWEVLQRKGIEAGRMIPRISLYRWEEAVRKAAQELEWEDVQNIQSYLAETLGEGSLHMQHWRLRYHLCRFRNMAAKGESEGQFMSNAFAAEIVRDLLLYAAENEKFCRGLFRTDLFETEPGLLPLECQMSLKLSDMDRAVDAGDFQRAVSDVKEVLEIMPELSELLRYCLAWISEKSEEG